ncbi:MAG: hypothetical protein AN484_27535, partial [Aphanizomenon flos-aquae WA102]
GVILFIHPAADIQVAKGTFDSGIRNPDITKLESELSFLHIKSTMSIKSKIKQVKMEICFNRRELAYARLESIAGADNQYSLMQVFGRGHIITRSGASMYVTHCNPVDVLPRTALNCTDEIPVTYNGTDVFVDPISMVIKSAGVITRCNDVAPPRWLIAGRWYCSYPAIKDCADPEEIPVQAVLVDEGTVVNQGLGRSIYSKEQLEEFVKFQDSHQVRKAYWAETAEIAYGGRGEGG